MFEEIIIKQLNADAQESAPADTTEATTATTNSPAEAQTEVPQAGAEESPIETAHDDFDWSIDKRNVTVYNQEEKKKYDKVYENTFVAITDSTLIKGTVVGLTKTDVVLNIGFKSDGLVSLNEFRDTPGLKVGDEVEVMVVEKEDREGHLNLSRRQARITRAWEKIVEVNKTGEVLEGTVKNITDFGAFMDLGGLDGLLYITDISWGRISHPSEVLKLDQKINVVVLDFDDEKKRISLGLKQLTPHPWDVLPENIKEGEIVKGKVVNIEDYGAFLEILPGVEGLVHVSEITWSNSPINAKEFFKLGDEYEEKIVTLDKDNRKMSLSIKQLSEDPWSTIEVKFPEGSRHTGLVKNITPYGVYVELAPGIGGMIHISDLSWLKRFNHPAEYTKVGEHIQVVILGIDKDNRKLQLGHKQLEEDPWNTLEDTFAIGTIHEGTVIRKDDKGAIVQLPYGLEGFAPGRHLMKEDGKQIGPDETAQFMVIEFDRNEKRIVLSHTRIWEQQKVEEKESARKEARTDADKTRKAVKNIQSKVEKPTLGDLGALAEIKKKLE